MKTATTVLVLCATLLVVPSSWAEAEVVWLLPYTVQIVDAAGNVVQSEEIPLDDHVSRWLPMLQLDCPEVKMDRWVCEMRETTWTCDGWRGADCAGDVTGDGAVGASDFMAVTQSWGECPSDP